jgi:uncharacterized protein YjbJ (UPF0337 family)
MNKDIRQGRWMQVWGRIKLAWARLVGNERLASDANAEVAAGALLESYGVAKKQTLREVSKGIDALAGVAKRAAKSLDR